MCHLLKNVLFLCLFSSISFASFDPGIYGGVIHPRGGGADVPVSFSFNYSSEYVDAGPDEMISSKRKIEGSFVVDNVGGPYTLNSVNYEFETGIVDIRYFRQDNTIGSPALRFSGTLKNGVIKGAVISGLNRDQNGSFGTFEIKKSTTPHVHPTPKYEGKFSGTFIYDAHSEAVPLLIGLDKTTGSVTNPADFELGYTPGHLGFFTLGTWEQAVHTIYIDYLRDQVYMTYFGPAGSITFIGTVTSDEISGEARSSFARIGSFSAKRLAPPQGGVK